MPTPAAYDEAIKQLRQVVDNSKDEELGHIAQLRLARLLIQTGKHDEALAQLNVEKAGAFAAQVREVRGDALLAKGDAQGARAEYAAALSGDTKGEIDRAVIELKLRDVGGDVPAPKPATAPASEGRLLMFSAHRARVVLAVLGAAFIALAGCKDKEIDPPAELVDIVAKRVVHRAWTTGLGGESSRLRLGAATDGRGRNACTRLRMTAKSSRSRPPTASTCGRPRPKLALSAGPEVDGGLVVLGSSDGDIVALDAANGSERWRKSIGSEVLRASAHRQGRGRDPHRRRAGRRHGGDGRHAALGGRRAGAATHAARHGAAGARGRSHHCRLR